MASLSWGELNDIVAGFACKSARYREALLRDPKLVLGAQIGHRLPDFLNVEVLEETASSIYLVIPQQTGDGDELTDADLDAVCGGSGRSSHVAKGVSPLRGGGGGGGGAGGDGGEAGYQCQMYGGGNMGTFNEIDTEMSVF